MVTRAAAETTVHLRHSNRGTHAPTRESPTIRSKWEGCKESIKGPVPRRGSQSGFRLGRFCRRHGIDGARKYVFSPGEVDDRGEAKGRNEVLSAARLR